MTDQNSPDSQEAQAANARNMAADDPLIGQILEDKIEIKSYLARGAYGAVYKGYHKLLDQFVAIKVLDRRFLNSETSEQRFLNEAQILSTFAHDNIVRFYSFGKLADGRKYMLLEYVEGKTLAQELNETGPMHAANALPIFNQISAALSYAHARNVVHRDVKPANVMLNSLDSGQLAVKLLDFGIFKATQNENQNLTQTGMLLGSANYMSPEQCRSQELDLRSDIYSLGCLMYETLVGKPPMHDDTDLLIMSNQTSKIVKSVPAKHPIPMKLEQCILRCLEKNPEDRFRDCKALSEELRSSVESQASRASKQLSTKRLTILATIIMFPMILCIALTLNKNPETKKQIPEEEYTHVISMKPSPPTSHIELLAAEKWIDDCVKYHPEIKPIYLSETFNSCAMYRINQRMPGLPPDSDAIEALLINIPKMHTGNFKDQLYRLDSLSKFYALTHKYEKTFQTLAKIEEKRYRDEAFRSAEYLKCCSALAYIFQILNEPQQYKRLIGKLRDHGQRSENTRTKAIALQREAEYCCNQLKDRETSRKLALKSCHYWSMYLEKYIASEPEHDLVMQMCKLLNSLGEPEATVKLIQQVYVDLSDKNSKIDDSMAEIKLYLAQAKLDLKDFGGSAKIAEGLVQQCLKYIPQNEISDDAVLVLLKATRQGKGSPQLAKHRARKYLTLIRRSADQRFYNSLQKVNDGLADLNTNCDELWREVFKEIQLDEKATPDDFRAISQIHMSYIEHIDSSVMPDKEERLRQLADGLFKMLDRYTDGPNFYIKNCIYLSQFYSDLGNLKRAEICLKHVDKYISRASTSVKLESEQQKEMLLKAPGLLLKDRKKPEEKSK